MFNLSEPGARTDQLLDELTGNFLADLCPAAAVVFRS